jgi:hypothetical protein
MTRSEPNSVRYFERTAEYDLPIRPFSEISAVDAKKMGTHYSYEKALYDSTGRLVTLNEIFNDRIIRRVNYFYNPNDMIIKCEISYPSRTGTISKVAEQYFNKSGKLTITKVKKNNKQGCLIEEEVVE